jgi:hypothetical protein
MVLTIEKEEEAVIGWKMLVSECYYDGGHVGVQ